MERFIIDKSNWKNFNLDTVIFILEEAKNYHEYTLSESEKITNRSFSLLILTASIISGLLGISMNLLDSDRYSIIYLNIFSAMVFSIAILCLVKVIFPKKLMVKGRQPKELSLPNVLVTPKLNNNENYLAIIINEIENVQHKINFNLIKNESRRAYLKTTIYILCGVFLFYAFSMLILLIELL